MPVFDWIRTDLAKNLPDGSNAMFFEKAKIENLSAEEMIENMEKGSKGFSLPGWEAERLEDIKKLFAQYKDVTEEDLFANLKYFLEKIIPVAEESGIKMAIIQMIRPGLSSVCRELLRIKKI